MRKYCFTIILSVVVTLLAMAACRSAGKQAFTAFKPVGFVPTGWVDTLELPVIHIFPDSSYIMFTGDSIVNRGKLEKPAGLETILLFKPESGPKMPAEYINGDSNSFHLRNVEVLHINAKWITYKRTE